MKPPNPPPASSVSNTTSTVVAVPSSNATSYQSNKNQCKLGLYSGRTDVQAFDICSKINGWSESEKLAHLTLALVSPADQLIWESDSKEIETSDDLVDRLRRQTRLSGLTDLARAGRLAASADEHHQILAALEGGNEDAIARLMSVHIGHTRGLWVGRDEDA